MPVSPDRMTEAILFTAISLAVPLILAWWLFGSRLSSPAGRAGAPGKEAIWIGALLGLSGLQLLVGGHWDAAMHIETGLVPGGSDFLWPPHIMIYLSFLISLFVATFSVVSIAKAGWAAGSRDPRQWVRSNPFLGVVAVASVYSLLSIPGDAIWHEIFGIDLTAWSPPHVLLMLTSATVILSGAGLLTQAMHRVKNPAWIRFGIVVMLAITIQLAQLIGVAEWELDREVSAMVLQRPLWFYPVVSGGLSLVVFSLARAMLRLRWAATWTAVADLGLRVALAGFLFLAGSPIPRLPLIPLLGAILLDMALNSRAPRGISRIMGAAGAYTAGFIALALPVLLQRSDLPFDLVDYTATILVTLAASLLLHPAGQWLGRALAGKERATPSGSVR